MSTRMRLGWGGLTCMALAACAGVKAPGPALPRGGTSAPKVSPLPSPKPSAAAVALRQEAATPGVLPPAAPAPTPWPEAWPRLSPQAGSFQGQVTVDVAYLLQAKAGILANHGASVVNAQGQDLLQDPALLLSNNGGNVISNHGSGLIGNHGASRRLLAAWPLLQAGAPASPPAVGTLSLVAGMMVTPVSLVDGQALAAPVLTDAQGRFAFELPPGQAANLRLEVAPPPQAGSAAQADLRLRYPTLAVAGSLQGVPIDEDTAQAGRSLAVVFRNQVRNLLLAPDLATTVRQIGLSLDEGSAAILVAGLERVRAAARSGGYQALPEARQYEVADRIANRVLADVDLKGTLMNPSNTSYTGPIEPSLPAMLDTMKAFREGATALLREDPKAFEAAPFLQDANASRAALGLAPFEIRKPSDLGALAGELVLADVNPNAVKHLDPILAFVRQGEVKTLTRADGSTATFNTIRVRHAAAANGMMMALGAQMLQKQAELVALLEGLTPAP